MATSQMQTSKTARLVYRDFSAEARMAAEAKPSGNAEDLAEVESAVTRATLLLRREIRRAA
jgi:hypothetical protein